MLVCDLCLLNPAILVVSRLSGVLGALGQILLCCLVHTHSCQSSLRQGQVHVGPITWEVLRHRPTPGLGLNLDLGQQTPPRPTLGSDRPRYRGAIITLPLASSGYGEQVRRPIWLAPLNK
jgi:hypothetical protein